MYFISASKTISIRTIWMNVFLSMFDRFCRCRSPFFLSESQPFLMYLYLMCFSCEFDIIECGKEHQQLHINIIKFQFTNIPYIWLNINNKIALGFWIQLNKFQIENRSYIFINTDMYGRYEIFQESWPNEK